MFKAILRENAGALATDTARDLSAWLTIAANVSATPILRSLDLTNRTVYDALVEIANASANDAATPTWLGFDIALAYQQLTGLLEFRTYTGQRGIDHRFPGGNPPLLLSPEAVNLDTVQIKRPARASDQTAPRPRPATPRSSRWSRSEFGRRDRLVPALRL